MRALIIGARGAVGTAVVDELERLDHDVVTAGRSSATSDVAIALDSSGGLAALDGAASEVDVVINCSGVERANVVAALATTPFVDISATSSYLAALRDAARSSTTTVVLGAGIAPGVSTVLASSLESKPGDEIDVAVMLGAGEAHGGAAVEWTAGLLGAEVFGGPEAVAVRNFATTRRFTVAGERRTYLRADFPDHVLVGDKLGVSVRTYLTMSFGPATASLWTIGRLPALSPLLANAPHIGDERWSIAATNRRSGEQLAACGVGQSLSTGVVTAHAAIAAANSPARGPVTLAQLMTLSEVVGLETIAAVR